MPAVILLAVLVVLSGFVWTRVFETAETVEKATRCTLPTAHTGTEKPRQPGEPPTKTVFGVMLPRDALNDTAPIPPQQVQVQVLNSNGQVNQATLVSKELTNLGFGRGDEPANDPVYTNLEMKCHAQIRFGPAGARAARTLSLIAPCAQLVRDQRDNATVDLALGSEFDGVKTTQEAQQVLQRLKIWGKKQQPRQGDQAAEPPVDQGKLAKARDVHC